ncbi:AAA family ATPase [Mesorhizobium opportunistum]|uniref:AAA family ATPase n=1 Tax=Mesorhizobium opportunistum TaxID=593909 RepID=UPI003335D85F
MYKLKSIDIGGFRGQKSSIHINVKESANFVIGRNGTGKTTLINLIYAALSADLSLLKEASFKTVGFRFHMRGSRKSPKIVVSKRVSIERGEEIGYKIQDSSTAPARDFVLSARRRRVVTTQDGQRRTVFQSETARSQSVRSLREILGEIYKTTWLSLQRGGDDFDPDEAEFDPDERGRMSTESLK